MVDINEKHWCTKCQKVCSGIDCECTKELNVIDVPEEPSDDVLYKDHPEIPTEADRLEYQAYKFKSIDCLVDTVDLITGDDK